MANRQVCPCTKRNFRADLPLPAPAGFGVFGERQRRSGAAPKEDEATRAQPFAEQFYKTAQRGTAREFQRLWLHADDSKVLERHDRFYAPASRPDLLDSSLF